MIDLRDRFERFVHPEPTSGCWLWRGGDARGYGVFNLPNKRGVVSAHRMSYTLYVAPIPAGLNVLHKCDVRCCVNPAHLELGTQRENMLQRGQRNRMSWPRGANHSSTKFTDEQIEDIRNDPRSTRVVGRAFGCSSRFVSAVKRGERRKILLQATKGKTEDDQSS